MVLRSSLRGRGILALLILEHYRKLRDAFLKRHTHRPVLKPLMKHREIMLIEELLAIL